MHLLDLPPEVFRPIIEAYVASTCYECDLKNLQLVNSKYLLWLIVITQTNPCRVLLPRSHQSHVHYEALICFHQSRAFSP